MNWSRLFAPKSRRRAVRSSRLALEHLESRLVPYSISGNAWPGQQLITLSFVPDGTPVSTAGTTTVNSNLFATLNAKFGSAAAWQSSILCAAQVWAQQTNLNFEVVPDDGSPLGSGGYQQGDPNKGDIRIGGYAFGNGNLATAFMPPPVNNYSIAGDVLFNTGVAFNSGSTYDLYTVAIHEIGHSLGLNHSSVVSAEMYAAYGGVKSAVTSDDVSGIRAIYGPGSARTDAYDRNGDNGALSSADDIGGGLTAGGTKSILADISTTSDIDYYTLVAPAGATRITVAMQSDGLSLLSPFLKICNSSGNAITSVSGTGSFGTTIQTTFAVSSGVRYYVVVDGADASLFGFGKYALNIGVNVQPNSTPSPDTRLANGEDFSGGGGLPVEIDGEGRVNEVAAGDQATSAGTARSTAIDAAGNYVVVWASEGQDGDGWGVYARRFDAKGTPLSPEFLVNTTTAKDQVAPTVAMSDAGNFVVVWQSPDGGGQGVFARRFGADGVARGSEFRVNSTTAKDQTAPAVGMRPDGSFVVVWTSRDQDGDKGGIYAREYGVDGIAHSSEFRVNAATTGDQVEPNVAVGPLGDYVVTWTSQGDDPKQWLLGGLLSLVGNLLDLSGWGVYARRFAPGGLALGSAFRVNTSTAGDQQNSSAAMAPDGSFVVTWASSEQDGDGWGIYARRYGPTGLGLTGDFRVNTTTHGDQQFPSVVMDASGDFLITWTSWGQDGDRGGVYVQQYAPGGAALGNEFQVNTTTAGEQWYSTATMNESGQMVVVWSGNGAGDDSGVFAQRYSIQRSGAALEGVSDSFDPSGHCCQSPNCPCCQPSAAFAGQSHGHETPTIERASLDRTLAGVAGRVANAPASSATFETRPATPAGASRFGGSLVPVAPSADAVGSLGGASRTEEGSRPLDDAWAEYAAFGEARRDGDEVWNAVA